MPKLYEVPNNTRILFRDMHGEKHELFFYHVDGMYSLCQDKEGRPCHLAAYAEVEVVEDGTSH